MGKNKARLEASLAKVHACDFWKAAVDAVEPIVKKRFDDPTVRKAFGQRRKLPKLVVTPGEYYVLDVWKRIVGVLHVFERIQETRALLAFLPCPARYRKLGMTLDRWNSYHLGQFLSAAVSSIDVCLLLTNDVYRIGLAEPDCKLEVLCRNRKVKGTPTASALKALDNTLGNLKFLRNVEVHRAEWAEIHEIVGSQDYELGEAAMCLLRLGVPARDLEAEASELLEMGTKELRDWVDGRAADLGDGVLRVLHSLDRPFEEGWDEADPLRRYRRELLRGNVEAKSSQQRIAGNC
jgi:hypothetical protein